MISNKLLLFFYSAIFLFTANAYAEDWPQWRGMNRNAIWKNDEVIDAIPDSGLEVIWRTKISGGYSGPAVVGKHVYVTDYVRESGDPRNGPGTVNLLQGSERVLCLNAETGEVIWKHEYDCPYRISYPAGPRTTPTIDGDRVYSYGAEGHLFCLNRNTGEVLWSKQMRDEYMAKTPIWGFSSHPLVYHDLLYCVVGGTDSVVIALEKRTGEEKWTAISASESGYAPPKIIEAAKTKQLIIWDADKINSLNPASGEVYWSQPLKPNYGMSIMAPQKSGDYLFASGIGDVGAVFKLDQDQPGVELVWRGNNRSAVYCSNSTPYLTAKTIYGNDCRSGALIAVDIENGQRLWTDFKATTGARPANHGTAFLVRHADKFFIFNETGDLVTAKLTRDGYAETGRAHLLEPTNDAFGRKVVWTHPAFANGCCYVRNDQEIICVTLKAKDYEE